MSLFDRHGRPYPQAESTRQSMGFIRRELPADEPPAIGVPLGKPDREPSWHPTGHGEEQEPWG